MTSIRETFGDRLYQIRSEGDALRMALDHYDNCFGFPDERCPIIERWRKHYIKRVSWYYYAQDRKIGTVRNQKAGIKANFSLDTLGEGIAEKEHSLSLPRRRRQNLQEIESKRDGIIRDRYYFGIYNKDY